MCHLNTGDVYNEAVCQTLIVPLDQQEQIQVRSRSVALRCVFDLKFNGIHLIHVILKVSISIGQWVIDVPLFFNRDNALLRLLSLWNEIVFKTCSLGEKGRDLTQSYDKTPTPREKIQTATSQHKTPPKTSITQRLRTDLGRPGQLE